MFAVLECQWEMDAERFHGRWYCDLSPWIRTGMWCEGLSRCVRHELAMCLFRGARRRLGRRVDLQRRQHETLEALHWMLGVEHRPRCLDSLGGADAVLMAATDMVLERVRCAPDGAPI